MVLKPAGFAISVVALVAVGSVAMADEYRPDEFLGLDLSKAVLSPKRLGPPTQFAPVAVEAKSDSHRASEPAGARNKLKTDPKKVAVRDVHVKEVRVTHPRQATHVKKATHVAKATHVVAAKPRGAARTRLAHRHGNPLDAQAMDTRIQKWPC